MSLTNDQLQAAVMAELSAEELNNSVVYVASTAVPAGRQILFPRLAFEPPWEALVAFVDLDPMANWSHPARYVFVSRASGEVRTLEAQLPPFRNVEDGDPYGWRVLYKAPSVPDALLSAPKL